MVSINNNLGIGALKATAKAETAGIQKDDGQVTVKEGALFPQEPKMEKTHYANYDDFMTAFNDGKAKVGDTFCSGDGIVREFVGIDKPTGKPLLKRILEPGK